LSRAVFATDEGSGPAVLLLHGQPGSGADWAGVARVLRESHRVVVPDRPGYGATGGRALGIAENACAMAALLEERGIEGAIVAGHSWGAGVAIAMAEHHPETAGRLVLVCPVTPEDRLGPVDRLLASRRIGPALARAALWAAGSVLERPRLRRQVARVLPGYGVERSPEIAREWRTGPAWRSFWTEQRALFDELPALRDGLPEIRQPTTVVVATHDRITDPAAGRRFAASVGARLVEVPRAGHLLPMQAPREVAEAIAA
jgi:pimeloyl-ACP methyl ester carboxylesterase